MKINLKPAFINSFFHSNEIIILQAETSGTNGQQAFDLRASAWQFYDTIRPGLGSFANFIAGFGDGASGGISFYLRNWVGQLTETPDVIDRSSGLYSGGEIAGIGLSFALHVGEVVQAVRGVRQLGAVATLGKCSFVAGTPVLAKDGQKPIDQLKPGDLVLSRNEQTGEQRYQRVTETFADPKDEIYDLTLIGADGSTETLGVTANHPFWKKDRGWTETDLLQVGDLFQGKDGAWITIKGLTIRAERIYPLDVSP